MKHQFWLGIAACAAVLPFTADASSHREAPAITASPRVDATDLYMFRSYEPGRGDYVTILANYLPFQDPQGGPNFFNLEENATYRINIDNNGDATPDISFLFNFHNFYDHITVPAGGKDVKIPLINAGPVTPDFKTLTVTQTYEVTLVKGNYTPNGQLLQNLTSTGNRFDRPVDNIGNRSIPDYPSYASNFIYDVAIPGCATPGRIFVGQRKESFFIAVGQIFDLLNFNPVQARDASTNDLNRKNITTLALEIPIKCLVKGNDPVIGAWTTVEANVAGAAAGDPTVVKQVSRLGMPLVNEVVIGFSDKDIFNASQPTYDARFLTYVTNPSLPILVNSIFGDAAKVPGMPRNDLVAAFLTGVKNLNQPQHVTPSEMLRLNTSIAPTPPAKQNDLGVLGNDLAGFPNGRRPYDDVVDITLRVAEGALCGAIGTCGTETKDPNNGTPYTDGVRAAGADAASSHVTGKIFADDTYLPGFPYLASPLAGSPQNAKP